MIISWHDKAYDIDQKRQYVERLVSCFFSHDYIFMFDVSSEVDFYSPYWPFIFPDVCDYQWGSWGTYSNELLGVFIGADSRLLLSIQNGFDGDLVSGDESDQDGVEESPVKKKPLVQQRNQVVAYSLNSISLTTALLLITGRLSQFTSIHNAGKPVFVDFERKK